jgi:hypothetical protein
MTNDRVHAALHDFTKADDRLAVSIILADYAAVVAIAYTAMSASRF